MIYWKLRVTDQMQCLVMIKLLLHVPRGLAALFRGDTEKNKSATENWRVKKVSSGGVSHSCLRCFYYILSYFFL